MPGIKIIYWKNEVSMFAYIILGSVLLGQFKDPYGLKNSKKTQYAHEVILQAKDNNIDPSEAIAIVLTESGFNPKAYSRTKDVGLFQVNCKWWYKKFKYKSIKTCERALLNPSKNIKAGLYILKYFRSNFKQCRGNLAYRCYNGGQGWYKSKNKNKIINYSKSVLRRKAKVEQHYKIFIQYYGRSYANG